MADHREETIVRIAELADDDDLRAGIIWALTSQCNTQYLARTVQAALELRASIEDDKSADGPVDLGGRAPWHD